MEIKDLTTKSMPAAHVPKIFFAFTLIYLVRDGKVLLLRRAPHKKVLPNQWLGVGGRVEEGEELEASARREFLEETGLHVHDLLLRGTFMWVHDGVEAGIVYIYVATKTTGQLLEQSPEGVLAWHTLESVDTLLDFAPHQRLFFPSVIERKALYSGMVFYKDGVAVRYLDACGTVREEDGGLWKETVFWV